MSMADTSPVEQADQKPARIQTIKNRLNDNIDEKERVDLWLALAEETHITNTKYALELSNRALIDSKELCYKKGQARSMQLAGICNSLLSHNDEAMTSLLGALWLFEELEDRRGEAKTLISIGNVLNILSDFEQAVGYFFQSSRIFQILNDKKGQGDILNSIGEVFLNVGDYAEALNYFNKSTRYYKEINDKQSLAIALKNIGQISIKIQKYEEALVYLERSVEYARGALDVYTEADSLNYIGQAYKCLERIEKARDMYFKCLLKCQEIGYRRGEGLVLLSLGQLFFNKDDHVGAEQYLQEALIIAEMIKARTIMYEANHLLALIYEKKGAYKKALNFHRSFYEEKERLLNKDISKKINLQKQSFEVNTVQKELSFYKGKYEEIMKAFKDLQSLNVALQNELDLKTRLNAELSKQLSGGDQQPKRDFLTELYTIRAMETRIKQIFQAIKKKDGALSIAVIEIDYLRSINQKYSNNVSNEAMKTVAKLLKENLRSNDFLLRYQGSKFALLLPDIKASKGYVFCEKLRKSVENYRWGKIAKGLKVTLSIGLSDDMSVKSYEELLDKARQKLVSIEKAGGNQVHY